MKRSIPSILLQAIHAEFRRHDWIFGLRVRNPLWVVIEAGRDGEKIVLRLDENSRLTVQATGISAEQEAVVRDCIAGMGVSEDAALRKLNICRGELMEAIRIDGTLPRPIVWEGRVMHLHEAIDGYLAWRRQTAASAMTRKERA